MDEFTDSAMTKGMLYEMM